MLIVALVLVLALAPAFVANSVTSPDEPVRFLSKPWIGWAFVGTVLVKSVSADAASPGAALTRAHEVWGSADSLDVAAKVGAASDPVAEQVKLLYLPADTRVRVRTIDADGNHELRRIGARRALAWQVIGRWPGTDAVGTIGLIDFSTATVVWNIRDTGKDADTP